MLFIIPATEPVITDLCDACGQNTICDNGECLCIEGYFGNPHDSCRPECVMNSDCERDRACLRNKCMNPCLGTCGQNAQCDVTNHIPICSCPPGFTGDPFTNCRIFDEPVEPLKKPCDPSPCGANSQCKEINQNAVCSCLQGYIGNPPQCRPECVVSIECLGTQACVNQKCVNPCKGACGYDARCEVINHSPICSCNQGQTGDPFQRCFEKPITEKPRDPEFIDPCQPSPCGANSVCRRIGDNPSCHCVDGYIGTAPNCRPECVINSDCATKQACINNKCIDPCTNSCGTLAECLIISHTVSCVCPAGYTGNPFVQCVEQKGKFTLIILDILQII